MAVRITKDALSALLKNMQALTGHRVLIGIPGDGLMRKDVHEPTNVELGFIHEFGSPAANIPPRPFLIPGVESGRARYIALMKAGARKTINPESGGEAAAMATLTSVGLAGQRAVRRYMMTAQFTPLAPRTIAKRVARWRRGNGRPRTVITGVVWTNSNIPNPSSWRPLIFTGQLRNAVTYVLERK